jgi:hypothetical protein
MKTPIRCALNSDRALCECVTLRAQNSNATTGRSSQVRGCIDVVQHVKLRIDRSAAASIRGAQRLGQRADPDAHCIGFIVCARQHVNARPPRVTA